MIAKFPSAPECRFIDTAQARRTLAVLASLAREAGTGSHLAMILQLARCEITSLLEAEEAATRSDARAAA